ncbi:glycoside hydrolase family 18 protein [Vararia minispora EC-137]|uniref:Glycoside hydrolase family 18 protein n=1 Tax=Vararia minispora EC-137 TaxID=1314806 RepID=A0ACB8QIA0_9AGAM|nr:glycoside hydrolase family 18 protein [Vararia minispora EC-137]
MRTSAYSPAHPKFPPTHAVVKDRVPHVTPYLITAAAWYAGWHSSDFTLSNISWEKYSSMIYSFAVTTPDVNTISLAASDQQLLPQFVQTAHQNNVNAILSIGGWTGSMYFSPAVATAANRTAFAQAVMNLVKQYDLDGVEFDWEYPGKQGIGCNILSSSDSANFLSFLQELRMQGGAGSGDLLVSAAVSITPFVGTDGTPMSNVSDFAKVLDTIEVMNYDVWGSWSPTVGPNAPLNDSCAPVQDGSAMSAVRAWTQAGFPANQILLGVASYGHSFHVSTSAAFSTSSQSASPSSQSGNGMLALYPPFVASQQPAGDKWDQTAGGVDACGNPNVVGGVFDFWGLIDGGFLNAQGAVAQGIDYGFDNCSQTPFVYNPTSQVMVSYDDATSFTAKGEFITQMGLAGFAMWEAGGDSNDILLDAIEKAMGIDAAQCSGN